MKSLILTAIVSIGLSPLFANAASSFCMVYQSPANTVYAACDGTIVSTEAYSGDYQPVFTAEVQALLAKGYQIVSCSGGTQVTCALSK